MDVSWCAEFSSVVFFFDNSWELLRYAHSSTFDIISWSARCSSHLVRYLELRFDRATLHTLLYIESRVNCTFSMSKAGERYSRCGGYSRAHSGSWASVFCHFSHRRCVFDSFLFFFRSLCLYKAYTLWRMDTSTRRRIPQERQLRSQLL